jgi:energy-coupling factor transporter transmembrane protein EcfT
MRGKKITKYWQKLKTHGFIMGKSIIINLERSEKLYDSLKLRGFSGKITFAPRKVKILDIVLMILLILMQFYFVYIINLQSIYEWVFGLFML